MKRYTTNQQELISKGHMTSLNLLRKMIELDGIDYTIKYLSKFLPDSVHKGLKQNEEGKVLTVTTYTFTKFFAIVTENSKLGNSIKHGTIENFKK